MNNQSLGYWFYMEPYVYINIKDNRALLMNMLDRNKIIVENEDILKLLRALLLPTNGGVIYLEEDKFKSMKNNLDILRRNFFCDMIPQNVTKAKPVQLVPQMNIIEDHLCKSKVLYRSRKELSFLVHEVYFYLSTSCNVVKCGNCKKYQDQVICCVNDSTMKSYSLETLKMILQKLINSNINYINLLGIHSLSDSEQREIINLIKCSDKKFRLILHACSNFLPSISSLKLSVEWQIVVDLSLLAYDKVNEYFSKFDKCLNIKIVFLISKNQDFNTIINLMNLYPSFKYIRLPFFNDDNHSFYTELITQQKNRYVSNAVTKQVILNKILNTNYWGKLFINPQGVVSADIASECLGNLLTDSIKDIVYKELNNKNGLWLYTKNSSKCRACVYQYLCPPPNVTKYSRQNEVCPDHIQDIIMHIIA